METVFISKLKPLLDALAETMELYVPQKSGEHYVFRRYEAGSGEAAELNNVRACTPAKEFLFPMRELAARSPGPLELKEVKPFGVFGLKECDINSIRILDKVFREDEFEDPLYKSRREKMFIIATDCSEPGDSCFCNLFDGKGYADGGFDLNVSKIKDGFIIETGSSRGRDFVDSRGTLFADVPEALLAERKANRAKVLAALEEKNGEMQFEGSIKEIVEGSWESEVFDEQAKNCIECQACTRVCPTCHCFYLYDAKQQDYFTKMKIWDSCMRFSYAAVAGGENPRKVLGERMKHRLMHKFVYFLERYGVNMCVGCGRCVDADAGGMDLREILKRLNEEYKDKDKEEAKAAK